MKPGTTALFEQRRFDGAAWLALSGALGYMIGGPVCLLLAFQQPIGGAAGNVGHRTYQKAR